MNSSIGYYVLLGSNEGDSRQYLSNAVKHLKEKCGRLVLTSAIYKTSPWGFEDQADFYNQCLLIQSELLPFTMLTIFKEIEKKMGRMIREKWKKRIIDIDILLAGNVVIQSPLLTVPHASLHERNFAMIPLLEIHPRVEHPLLNVSIQSLLKQSEDGGHVQKLNIQ